MQDMQEVGQEACCAAQFLWACGRDGGMEWLCAVWAFLRNTPHEHGFLYLPGVVRLHDLIKIDKVEVEKPSSRIL